MRSDLRECLLLAALAALLTALGGMLAYKAGVRGLTFAITLVTFAMLVSGYCLLGARLIVDGLRRLFAHSPERVWLAAVLVLVPYLFYALGTESINLNGALRLLAFITVPTLLLYALGRLSLAQGAQLALLIAAILAIWLPFDFRLLRNIWLGKTVYGFNTLLAVNLAVLLFVCYQRIEGVGYHFRVNREIVKQGIINLLIFTPIAITIGLLTGFLTWAPRGSGLKVLLDALGIFLFIALPEELLFRGLIQNLLAKKLNNERTALIIASVVFGAAHLNNASYPRNIIYFFLATIAGIFYGRAYIATGALLAGAITHTLVDTIWHELFK